MLLMLVLAAVVNSPFEYQWGMLVTGVFGDYQHDRGALVTGSRELEILFNFAREPGFELDMRFGLRKGVANPCAKPSDRCEIIGTLVFHDRETGVNDIRQSWTEELQESYQVSERIVIAPEENYFHFSGAIQKNLMYGSGHLTVIIRKGKTTLYRYRAKLVVIR